MKNKLLSGLKSAPFTSNVSRCKAIPFVAAARLLACVLAGALLLFEVLGANNAFHQALHHNGKAASNTCVVCLLAKGQIDAADASHVFSAPVRLAIVQPLPLESAFVPHFSSLSFPSRAPPALHSPLSVVA